LDKLWGGCGGKRRRSGWLAGLSFKINETKGEGGRLDQEKNRAPVYD